MKFNEILLVEDNSNDIELTVVALSAYNNDIKLSVARDGVEALEFLQCQGSFTSRNTGNPALILLDIKMPRMDGLEVLAIIRSLPEFNRIPVVILTSSKEDRDIIRAYELGVNAYVVKPVNFDEFMEVIRQIGTFWIHINEVAPE